MKQFFKDPGKNIKQLFFVREQLGTIFLFSKNIVPSIVFKIKETKKD